MAGKRGSQWLAILYRLLQEAHIFQTHQAKVEIGIVAKLRLVAQTNP
jgi:hypothetical protein